MGNIGSAENGNIAENSGIINPYAPEKMEELLKGFDNIIESEYYNNNTTKLERIVTIYKHVIEMYDLNKIYALDRYTALYPRLFDLASLISFEVWRVKMASDGWDVTYWHMQLK